MNSRARLVLIAILLIAAAARFAGLDSIPRGIYPDEALDGNEGYSAIAHGTPHLFYPENSGREGLFINLTGASIAILGSTPTGLRAVSALAGTLAVLLIFALGREWFCPRAGLFAAFLLAVSFWHLNFSRLAFRGILVPTLLLAAVYGFLRGRRSLPWAAFGGIAFGLGFHSYLAFRAAPLVALVLLLLERRHRKTCAVWLAAAALTTAPLAIHYLEHPEDFTSRTGQLSLLDTASPARALMANILHTAAMFHYKGDCNPRSNLACQPELNLPAGLLLLIGLGCAVLALCAGFRKGGTHSTAAWTLLMWIPAMLAPAVLSNQGIPHALRSIGVIPALFLLAGWGAETVMVRFSGARWNLRWAACALIAILIAAGVRDLYRYFAVWSTSPVTRESFMATEADLADYLNALPTTTPRFVIADEAEATAPLDPADPTRRLSLNVQPLLLFTGGLTHDHPPITYLRVVEFLNATFPPGSVVVPLLGDTRVFDALRDRGIAFTEESRGALRAAHIR